MNTVFEVVTVPSEELVKFIWELPDHVIAEPMEIGATETILILTDGNEDDHE